MSCWSVGRCCGRQQVNVTSNNDSSGEFQNENKNSGDPSNDKNIVSVDNAIASCDDDSSSDPSNEDEDSSTKIISVDNVIADTNNSSGDPSNEDEDSSTKIVSVDNVIADTNSSSGDLSNEDEDSSTKIVSVEAAGNSVDDVEDVDAKVVADKWATTYADITARNRAFENSSRLQKIESISEGYQTTKSCSVVVYESLIWVDFSFHTLVFGEKANMLMAYGDVLSIVNMEGDNKYRFITVFGGLTICFLLNRPVIAHVLQFRVDNKSTEILLLSSQQLNLKELFETCSETQVFSKRDLNLIKCEIYAYFASFSSDQVKALKKG